MSLSPRIKTLQIIDTGVIFLLLSFFVGLNYIYVLWSNQINIILILSNTTTVVAERIFVTVKLEKLKNAIP